MDWNYIQKYLKSDRNSLARGMGGFLNLRVVSEKVCGQVPVNLIDRRTLAKKAFTISVDNGGLKYGSNSNLPSVLVPITRARVTAKATYYNNLG
jgi:hypothetical protein